MELLRNEAKMLCIVRHCEIKKYVYQFIFLFFLFHKYALTNEARSELKHW